MDRESVLKQMKALKSKAKAARKAGKKEIAATFKSGASRLHRVLKASAPKKKAETEAAAQ